MRYRALLPVTAGLVGLIALACSSGSSEPDSDWPATLRPTAEPTVEVTKLLTAPTVEATAPPKAEPTAQPTPTPAPEKPQVTADGIPISFQLPEYMTLAWKTDFSKHSVSLN